MQEGQDSESWDMEYFKKGRLWSGKPVSLPCLPSGSQALELGCGNGKNMREMVRKGWMVTGLDISHRGLELCKAELVGTIGGSYSLVEGDARKIPFPDGSFDAIFAIHLLGHFLAHDREVVMGEAARVLAPGGRFFVRVFSNADMRAGVGIELEPNTFRRGTGIIVHYFQGEELVSLAEGAGLKISKGPDLVGWSIGSSGSVLYREEVSMECTR